MRAPRRLTPLQRQLAADFWPLAVSLTRRHREARPDLAAEILSEAGVALVRAAGRCQRPGALPAYLRRRIPGAALDAIARESRHDHQPLPEDL